MVSVVLLGLALVTFLIAVITMIWDMAISRNFLSERPYHIVGAAMILCILFFTAGVVTGYMHERQECSLHHGQWKVVGHHLETSTTFVRSGSVNIPITSTYTVDDMACVGADREERN
jgi:hypothetical protein